MTLLIKEILSQNAMRTEALYRARNRLRGGVFIASYGLIGAAGAMLAILLAETVIITPALFGSGAVGGVFIAALALFRARLNDNARRLDQALDLIASIRAMTNEVGFGANEAVQFERAFHSLSARRTIDIFGRQTSVLYVRRSIRPK